MLRIKTLCASLAPICLLSLALPLAACRNGSGNPHTYASDLTATELADAVSPDLSEDFFTADAAHLSDYVPLPRAVPSLCVRITVAGDRIDEYGVLQAEGDAAEWASTIRSYLAASYEQNRAFYDSYIPTETPKLRDAEVRIFGDYVVWAILSEGEKAALFDRAEAVLSESERP